MRIISIPSDSPPPLFSLGILLEQVVLAMDDRKDAESFRCTCKTAHSATQGRGFLALWRAAHPDEVKAEAEISKLKTHFKKLDEEFEMEAEVQSEQEIRWERILPHKGASSEYALPAVEASAVLAPVPPPPSSVSEAKSVSGLRSYFEALESWDLPAEVESPSPRLDTL